MAWHGIASQSELRLPPERQEKQRPVFIIQKDDSPRVAASGYVMDCTGEFKAERAEYGKRLAA